MKKIDGHVHACGMIINTEGAMEYIKKYDLDKIVLTAGEPDSTKDYKMPYMSKMFKSSRLVYFMNFFISFLTGIKKLSRYIDQGNEKVALMAEELPDYILNTYWINPLEEDAIYKMEKFHEKHSFCMIKMHQCWTNFDLDDKKTIAIFEWAQKYKIPVFLHLKSKKEIIKFKKILKEYSNVIFILGHLIGIEEFDRTVGDNVYFDISCAPLHSTQMLKKTYDNFGAKRIILGSDAPYGVDNINLSIGQMHDIGMSAIEVESVCYKNIQEILRIDTEVGKFDSLTKYIPLIQVDSIGEWVIDKENDGTPEHPIHMGFVNYSEVVKRFISEVYAFEKSNKDMELTRYVEILKENGLEWGMESMKDADVSKLNAQCVLALIMGAVRAERFCDGALLNLFKSGYILKWLERLNSIE